MCGFVGFLDLKLARTKDSRLEVLRGMADAIRHRGPDDEGYWLDPECQISIGSRRLAIVEVSPLGAQPMVSNGGRYVLAFNGEIYNHIQLRDELERHVPFRGRSDTEVMLAAIEHWGLQVALERFRGMFAVALWDTRNRALHLVRDRFGKKPLYYGWQGSTFVFGSEIKALRAHPAFSPEVDTDSVGEYLRFSCVPGQRSIYRGIRKLLPGSILSVDTSGSVSPEPRPYWRLHEIIRRGREHPFAGTIDEAAKQLEAVLSESVKLRMIADVPLGAFLSGGIDSSTIVALMQAHSRRKIQTFTIGFRDRNYNEAEHARAIADHLGTEHRELYLDEDAIIDVLPRMPEIYDEPFADSSQIPTYLVSKLARSQVTVALSGDGGDELFGGYYRHFLGPPLWNTLHCIPKWMRRGLASVLLGVSPTRWDTLLERVNPFLRRKERRLLSGERLHKLASLLEATDFASLYNMLVSTWRPSENVALALGGTAASASHDDLAASLEPAHRLMYYDTMGYLVDDILVKLDRATMAVSLEGRTPYLDHLVAELAWSLPLGMKIQGKHGKAVLRLVLERYVPRKLFERPKAGFGIPIGKWLRGGLRPWAEALLDENRLRREGFLRPEPIRQAWREHVRGERDWQARLWNVLMFEAWLEREREPAQMTACKVSSESASVNRKAIG